MHTAMRLKYEPSSEPLHISAKCKVPSYEFFPALQNTRACVPDLRGVGFPLDSFTVYSQFCIRICSAMVGVFHRPL